MNHQEAYARPSEPPAESQRIGQTGSQAAIAAEAVPPGSARPVVFFDGVCGLCDRFVDFVLRRDPRGYFRFAPLQGQTAAQRLGAADIADLKTVVVVEGSLGYRKSAAVIHVLHGLGGFWAVIAGILWIVPRPIRDLGYSCVANNRYALFGKKETCRLPTAQERSRFLP
jgi:predicted DCC family thiol-disulfide oxidoreductase YuxK